jgi:hypothetical protein
VLENVVDRTVVEIGISTVGDEDLDVELEETVNEVELWAELCETKVVDNLLVELVDVAGGVGARVAVVGLLLRQTPLLPQVCPGLHAPQRLPMVQRVPGLSQQTALLL